MKDGIHPAYGPVLFHDTAADSHPFWTGNQRIVDTAGQVERFRRRFGDRTRGAS